MAELTHFNEQGRARMVDVTEKAVTHRRAVAAGEIHMAPETLQNIKYGTLKNGRRAGGSPGGGHPGRPSTTGS